MTNEDNNQQAVTFDAVAFRAWLDEPAKGGDGTNRDANPMLATGYQRGSGEAGWLVETTLLALNALTGNPMWEYATGVSTVQVRATAHPEGATDGGLMGHVAVDGVPVSLGLLTEAELVPQDDELLPGYEAAEHALTALAERVNVNAAAFRKTTGRGLIASQLTGDEVEQALTLLANQWLSARIGSPKRINAADPQRSAAEKVLRLVAGEEEAERMGL